MESFKAKLVKRIKRTDLIESFRFVADKPLVFKPGQFLQLVFDSKNPSNRDLNKYLSCSASPLKPYLEVTKRLSQSDFSQTLKNLALDSQIVIKGPFGRCYFDDVQAKIAFLVGGIGITPVISILEYMVDKKLNTDAVLFYSARNASDLAFKYELDLWQKNNPRVKVFYLLTEECANKVPEFLYCKIGADVLKNNLHDWLERDVYIFGPPGFVTAISLEITKLGVPREQLKTEGFIGY